MNEIKRHITWETFPLLLNEIYLSKNEGLVHRGKTVNVLELTCGTHKKLDWKCSVCEHEWKATGDSRVNGSGCPACSGRLHSDGRNSMSKTHPKLTEEYQGDASKIIAGTHKKLDWKCSVCEHEWKATGDSRVNGSGCPTSSEWGYNPSKTGYVYVLHYSDDSSKWLKCGATNNPLERIGGLIRGAKRRNIEVVPLEQFEFDGVVARQCESELLDMKEIRFESEYDIDGKTEFFKPSAFDQIMDTIQKYQVEVTC